MSFAFGADTGDGPPSENPGGPPKDEKTQLEEMTEKFVNLKLKYKEVRVKNGELERELIQTKNLLGSMTAPTVFNQLQVNYIVKILIHSLYDSFVLIFQKAGTMYLERHPLKYPKRAAAKAGLRPRSHLSTEERRVFDAFAKQEYWDLRNDVDGNDRPNLLGILEGTAIATSDVFFDKVYKMMRQKLENRLDVAAGGSAGGDPNVLFMDTDEEK